MISGKTKTQTKETGLSKVDTSFALEGMLRSI